MYLVGNTLIGLAIMAIGLPVYLAIFSDLDKMSKKGKKRRKNGGK